MTRRINPTLICLGLLVSSPVIGQTRHSIGGAFEKDYKSDKKPKPTPTEWSPDDKKRLMGEVSEGFYADAVKAKNAGRLNEALTLFDRVLILDPNNEAARRNVAEIKQRMDAATKAKKTTVKASTTRLLTKLWNDADAAARNENWDEAQLIYKKILAIDPDNKKAKAKLGLTDSKLFEQLKRRGEEREAAGDKEGALDAFQLALTHGDDDSLRTRLDNLKAKIEDSNRKKSDDAYAEALGASQQGNNEKALGLCRKALRLDPSNIQAQRMLERLERKPR